MRGKRQLSSRQLRGLLAGVGCLLLIVGGLSYHYVSAHGSLLPLAQKIVPVSSDSSAADTQKIIDTQAAAPATNTEGNNSPGNGAGEQQPASLEPKMDEIMDSSADTAANNCDDKMAAAVNDYNNDVQKKKNDLVSSIKFPPVPLSISKNYVKSFNDDITELFNNYLSAANEAHCTWPLKSPVTLPLDFIGQ